MSSKIDVLRVEDDIIIGICDALTKNVLCSLSCRIEKTLQTLMGSSTWNKIGETVSMALPSETPRPPIAFTQD